MPMLASALAALGLAAGLTLAGTATARADVTPPVAQWIPIHGPYLHAKINTLCFEDPNGSTASGTAVQLGHCHGYAADGTLQRWVFVQAEDVNGNPLGDHGSAIRLR
jgi:hypothetical protein